MYDVVIIGAGPAGISSAVYSKRAGKNVLVLYYGASNLEKATKIDNYYGFEEGIDGRVLFENGIKQAKNLGIEIKKEEVLDIKKEKDFIVETENRKYESKAVIISTGNKKLRPNIKGIDEFEGKGISYCAICDGFFYRNKNVAIIGEGKFALKEAGDLKDLANKITILTNGKQMENEGDYEINIKAIKEIQGDTKVRRIEFEDGSTIDIDGLFIAIGVAGGSNFAKKLGVKLQADSIIVDDNMQTNLEGLYACGDATGGLLQVCKATYEGAKAGLSAVQYLNKI